MDRYLCEKCNFNNNGWCKIKQFNGLRKRNIQECNEYKTSFDEKDRNLDKLIELSRKEEEKFWNEYMDEEYMPNDLLDTALRVINLQKGAIDNLLVKINSISK